MGQYIFKWGDVTTGVPDSLLGIPIEWTGKVATAGNYGDASLVDFSKYLIKDGRGPLLAMSPHVRFENDQTVIRIVRSLDGQGWVNAPLTLMNGKTQVSPYVCLQ